MTLSIFRKRPKRLIDHLSLSQPDADQPKSIQKSTGSLLNRLIPTNQEPQQPEDFDSDAFAPRHLAVSVSSLALTAAGAFVASDPTIVFFNTPLFIFSRRRMHVCHLLPVPLSHLLVVLGGWLVRCSLGPLR